MYLALQVTSSHAGVMGMNASKVFTEAGGTIGRVAGNDWVLPDEERFVSGLHVIIRYIGGSFSLEDVSTNGTFINGDPEPVGARNEPVVLKNGDNIAIGDYQVFVSIMEGDSPAASGQTIPPPSPGVPSTPAPGSDPTVPPAVPGISGIEPPSTSPEIGPIDPLELLGSPPVDAPPPAPAAYHDHAPAESANFIPPATPEPTPGPAAGGSAIPDDWELTGFSMPSTGASQAPQPPTPEPAQAAPPGPPAAKQASGRGRGEFDELMPMLVQGMMEILKSRAEVKNQFRVTVTTIKPVDNNPLKFSPTAEAAMDHLFSNRQPGYLDARGAFEEAFADIKAHELAMMAGMRAAFEHMLKQFSPDVLEDRFEAGGKRGGLMGMSGKSRYWELYRDFFDRLTRDSEDNFRHLFGEEFAEAYEKQLQQLRGQ